MYWICVILVLIILGTFTIYRKGNWLYVIVPTTICLLLSLLIIAIDYNQKTADTEIWSGQVVDWFHKEEWDEWHPPVTTCTTNSDGQQSCSTSIGYWEHHKAINKIKTSDNGWFYVYQAPDGTKFDDSYPNDIEALKKYWDLGTPSSSTHTYRNKVKASYSIYRHQEIDLEKYSDLPEYPNKAREYIHIDRIVGQVPNKNNALKVLDAVNTELNKMIPDPEKEGKLRSWKQVNIVFVNVGLNKSADYGFALQDKWQGGNKNDFIVAFSLGENNNVLWVYPFSWSEVELLKIEVRDYMLDLKTIDDFIPVVERVGEIVADKFERKQFSDFNYLQIETSRGAKVVITVMSIIVCIIALMLHWKLIEERDRFNKRYRSYKG